MRKISSLPCIFYSKIQEKIERSKIQSKHWNKHSIGRLKVTTLNVPNAETLIASLRFSHFNDRDKHRCGVQSLHHTIYYSWSYCSETFIVYCSKWIQLQATVLKKFSKLKLNQSIQEKFKYLKKKVITRCK